MSAFSSLLKTFGGNDVQTTTTATTPPPSGTSSTATKPMTLPAVITGNIRNAQSKSAPATPSATSVPASVGGNSVYKGTAGLQPAGSLSGVKRKAEEISTDRMVKPFRSLKDVSSSSDQIKQKPSKPNGVDTKSHIASKNNSSATNGQSNITSNKPAPKAPSKGSYAEMMARAKEAAQSKPPSQIGLIKHQATEKSKPSKFTDRRKAEQSKSKVAGVSQGRAGTTNKTDSRHRSASPVKVSKRSDGPKIAKAPQPPLHAPSRPKAPAYRGTMGQGGSKRSQPAAHKKKSRYDEYLGTDEEEDADDGYGYGEDEEDQYGSDASSDMEGGFDDIEVEERMGLRAAVEDDARELALENKLKKEKMERKEKLAALAAKRR